MKAMLIGLLVALSPGFANAQENAESAIKKTVESNLAYLQKEDMEGAMSTIHSKSPAFAMTKEAQAHTFSEYDLSYELLSYKYIGSDGEYACARVKQKTSKVAGPAFSDNELDMLQVFKREGDVWKLWAQANLEIRFVN